MLNPLVTVYLVNHNYSRFIRKSIESVLAQTMKSFELLIIDDGSTDNSREIISKYEAYPNISVIFQRNKGLNVTNNIALRAARGKYIIRLDADDWLDENALHVMSSAMERDPEIGLLFPDYYMVSESGQVLEVVRRHDFSEVTLHDQPAHGACTMARRALLQEIGGYDESFRCQDGYDIWLRFIAHAKIRNINLPLFYYRQHNSSLSKNEIKILDTRSKIIQKRIAEKSINHSALVVIPVRGRIVDPRSMALENLGDKALIDWTIDAALSAECVENILVTSPDPEVINHVNSRYRSDVLVHLREKNLAQINSFLDDTIKQAAEFYVNQHEEPQAVVALYAESPFRYARHIDTALNVLSLYGVDSVIAVRPETDVFYQHDGHGLKPLRSGHVLRLEAEEIFRAVGDMHVVSWSWLMAGGGIPGGSIGHVILEQSAALSVTNEWEWRLAKVLADEISKDAEN